MHDEREKVAKSMVSALRNISKLDEHDGVNQFEIINYSGYLSSIHQVLSNLHISVFSQQLPCKADIIILIYR